VYRNDLRRLILPAGSLSRHLISTRFVIVEISIARSNPRELAFGSESLTICADMSFFSNSPDDWQRLDWQILRDGGIQLYWRREYLIEESQWFAKHDYDLFEFACETWESQDSMFSDFARTLRLPDYFGRNFDALDECIADLPLTENRGGVIVLTRFDAYAAGAGSTPMGRVENEAQAVLDIIARASRFHLLNGNRLVALVQTDDPQLRFGAIGGASPRWNHREWLNANRQSNPA